MPHDKNVFPYVVVGDGIIATTKLADLLKITGKPVKPVPMFFFAKSKARAETIAKQIAETNETVVIAKIVKVTK